MELPDGPTEESTDRDGFLSYAIEVHALIMGSGIGIAAAVLGRPELVAMLVLVALGLRAGSRLGAPVVRQVRQEPWYAIGGALSTYVVTALLTAASLLPV